MLTCRWSYSCWKIREIHAPSCVAPLSCSWMGSPFSFWALIVMSRGLCAHIHNRSVLRPLGPNHPQADVHGPLWRRGSNASGAIGSAHHCTLDKVRTKWSDPVYKSWTLTAKAILHNEHCKRLGNCYTCTQLLTSTFPTTLGNDRQPSSIASTDVALLTDTISVGGTIRCVS